VTIFYDADLPVLLPQAAESSAKVRELLNEARSASPLAKGPFGAMVLRHEEVTALLLTQLLPSSTWPLRSQLTQLVSQAILA